MCIESKIRINKQYKGNGGNIVKKRLLGRILSIALAVVLCLNTVCTVTYAQDLDNKSEIDVENTDPEITDKPEVPEVPDKPEVPEEPEEPEVPDKPEVNEGWGVDKDGNKMYFEEGNPVSGWKQIELKWYYFDEETGFMITGWKYVDEKWYYMDEEGIMTTGWQYVDGHWYYMNASGVMKIGWIYVKDKWYYMNASGQMKIGWVYVDEKWYHTNEYGMMQTGWIYVDEKWYYMKDSGAMEAGKWIKLNGKYYCLRNDGSLVVSGYTDDGYYVNSKGEWSWDSWEKNSTGWWYSLKEGGYATGWKKINGYWYYFDMTSGYMKTGWLLEDENWFYLAPDGHMYASNLYRIGNSFYAFNGSGIMYSDTSYYFNGGYVPLGENGNATGVAAEVLLKADNVLNVCGRSMWDAFQWTIGNIKYSSSHMSGIGPGENDVQSLWYAKHGFDYKLGNCYVEAAAFCWMSRLLGVETHFIKGHVVTKNGKSRHGWCEAIIDGEIRVFDLTFSQSGRDGYNKQYGEKGTWKYVEYERVL